LCSLRATNQEVAGVSVEIGNFLRQARESVGLSLDELQDKTRIQKSFLEAIEKGDFDKLPSPFYVRTYLRSYANCVKVEPHYILREYRKMEQSERYQTGKFDASQLTATLSKLSQTGMHKFDFSGTDPKMSPTTSSSASINRTTAKTALTIAKPISQTGKLPMTKRREELAKTAKPQVLSSPAAKPIVEKKFPSLLPSQALTTKGKSLMGKEKRFSTGNNAAVTGNQESRITAEQTAVTKSTKLPTNKHAITGQAQTVPSRLNKPTGSPTLSRTLANKRPTQPEQVVSTTKPEKTINKENTSPLSRTSRLRNASNSLADSLIKSKESLQEEPQVAASRLPSRSISGGLPEEVSANATGVKTLRRSNVHQMNEKNDRFFSSRVIIASVVAVLLLTCIGWHLLADDGEEGKETVKKETPTSTETTTSQEKQQTTASPSTEETSEEPDLKKIEPGLYHLTGTNEAKIVIKPKTSVWLQIRDNNDVTSSPKKYIKDVTLNANDGAFQYTHTFSSVNDLYLVFGSVDNVEITVNDIPVKSAKLIHIVKK
jgi:cytoskeletal protein RodZ